MVSPRGSLGGNVPSALICFVRGNCDPLILEEMRRHYPKPYFLPEDAEIPSQEYVFMGYDDGATMHVSVQHMYVFWGG